MIEVTLRCAMHRVTGWRLEDGTFYLALAGWLMSRALDTAIWDRITRQRRR